MTEHRHRVQLPLWAVGAIAISFMLLLVLGFSIGGWGGVALGLFLSFGFLSLAGARWGYDSTDGRSWKPTDRA